MKEDLLLTAKVLYQLCRTFKALIPMRDPYFAQLAGSEVELEELIKRLSDSK